MDLEQALETQRVRLLRLVTGWAMLLGILSVGPAALPVPRWVRAFFEIVLIRAELAAQYMVQTSALIQGAGQVIERGPVARTRSAQAFEVPSTDALITRIKALCDVLDNLPRYARRLVRVRKRSGVAFDFNAPPRFVLAFDCGTMVRADWTAPRIERPPDKDGFGLNVFILAPPAMRAGGVGGWAMR